MKDDVFLLYIYNVQGFDLVFGVRHTKERDRVTFLTPHREGRSHPPRGVRIIPDFSQMLERRKASL